MQLRDFQGQWVSAMCLIPGADLLNTVADESLLNTVCKTQQDGPIHEASFQCETIQEIHAGEELVTAYISSPSRRTNELYFLNYGFVPERNSLNSVEMQVCWVVRAASFDRV